MGAGEWFKKRGKAHLKKRGRKTRVKNRSLQEVNICKGQKKITLLSAKGTNKSGQPKLGGTI